jgi:glycosyltransferase involved in cell wall biosynthesis
MGRALIEGASMAAPSYGISIRIQFRANQVAHAIVEVPSKSPARPEPGIEPRGAGVPVMLLISSLEHGGAERQVVELANALDEDRFDVTVCSLSEHVPLAAGLRDADHRLVLVPRKRRYDAGVVWRLARLMRERRILLVHCFLFDAEMAGRLAARLAGVPIVVSSERNSDYPRSRIHEWSLRATRSWFDLMIANSEAGKRFNMRTLDLPESRIRVIRNGVDVTRFKPGNRMRLRRELGISSDAPVVGMVAAFKRQKRYEDFFRVAEKVLRRFPEAHFLCVGEPLRDNLQGSEDYHGEIRRLAAQPSFDGRIHFLGRRQDMPDVYNACDVTVLTSSREGTPNVLLESMACGVPVVATDVADNALLVPGGDVGFIVKVGEVQDMADRVAHLLAYPWKRLERGRIAREWIVRECSTTALARKTADTYNELLRRKRVETGLLSERCRRNHVE